MTATPTQRSPYGSQPFGLTVFGAPRADVSDLPRADIIELTNYIKQSEATTNYLTLTKSQDVEL